jgi:hypothetical protein
MGGHTHLSRGPHVFLCLTSPDTLRSCTSQLFNVFFKRELLDVSHVLIAVVRAQAETETLDESRVSLER